MVKNENLKVVVNVEANPYRAGTMKFFLMKWALDKKEFTKAQFLEAVLLIKAEKELTSRMNDEVLPKAWWNEFFNKHKTFTLMQ